MVNVNASIELNEREERIIREWAGEIPLGQLKKRYYFRFNANQLKQWCDKNGVQTCSRLTFPNEDKPMTCRVCGKTKTRKDFSYVQTKRRDICNECANKRRLERKAKRHGA